jgi:flagellar biosynthesis protein FlhF
MQLQTFKAPTMAECLSQVKTAMGTDAIILHTRAYQTKQWLGLRKREVVEITAGKGMKVASRPRPGQAADSRPADRRPVQSRVGLGGDSDLPVRDRQPGSANGSNGHGGTGGSSGGVGGATIPGTYGRPGTGRPAAPSGADVRPPAAEPRSIMDTPAAASAAMLSLSHEVTTLKQLMKDLLVATRQKQASHVPEELFDYYEQLTASRVSDEFAGEIVKALQRQVRPEHYAQPQYMREKIAEQVERMIPTAGPIARGKSAGAGRPHVVALVGPTGVGKTTTLAKLAANLKLRERHRVGLITLDTYRIAAVDQLRRYAEIIGAPLKVVGSADELKDAVRAMGDMEFVLIDTAGRSPNDRLKLNELKRVLESAKPDEVHLVLSTTASQESMELAAAQFGDVRTDKLLFTKLDEAAHLGAILNVARKVNKPISYLTTGQDVPDDIEVGQGKRLAQLVLGESLYAGRA